MTGMLATALLFCALSSAKDRKLPTGQASNDVVLLEASVLDSDAITQIFGSDFKGVYQVLEVTLTPKAGKTLDMKLDDFLLRSDMTGEHTGPLLPGEIAGQGALVVKRGDPPKQKGGFGGGFGGIMMGGGGMGQPDTTDRTKVEMKEDGEKDPMLKTLKRKILAEKPITETVTGLLFFPFEKEKPKHLALVYTTPSGKIRTQFK